MFRIDSLHHVSIPVSDLNKAKEFYRDLLGLEEKPRPQALDDAVRGAWYHLPSDREVHLIVHNNSTFRVDKEVDSGDIHFAIRVVSYRETRDFLRSKGYHRRQRTH